MLTVQCVTNTVSNFASSMYTVIRKSFVSKIYSGKDFVLKYFCGLGQPQKCITTKIYTFYEKTLRKWQITQEIFGLVAFTGITSWEVTLGKQKQESLRMVRSSDQRKM